MLARDTGWTARGVKEAVESRKTVAHAMNKDGGAPPTSIGVLQILYLSVNCAKITMTRTIPVGKNV